MTSCFCVSSEIVAPCSMPLHWCYICVDDMVP